jgi:hypothetical protein
MPEYVVEIYGEVRHQTRLWGDDKESVKDQVWQGLDDLSRTPNEIAGPAVDAYVQRVRVRELYDWEK